MKKFSKLILESKKELWTKHPLVNPVDWDNIFKPLIEHIEGNLRDNVPPPGEGIFNSRTKSKLDDLMDAITEDYIEYYANVVDDGSQESFFNAYSIDVKWHDLMDCLQPLMDKTSDVDDYPNWDGGYYYMELINLKYDDTKEFIEDILDINGKLKMFKINSTIYIKSKVDGIKFFSPSHLWTDKNIEYSIKNLLELPGQKEEDWIKGLDSIEIYIYNKDTVQAIDLFSLFY